MAEFFVRINKKSNDYVYWQNNSDKFYADSFNFESEDFLLIMNGVNFKFNTTNRDENIRFCLDRYNSLGKEFFSSFRGTFSGVLFDKRKSTWIIFNNHFGDQRVFYSETEKFFFIGSDFFHIHKELTNAKAILTLKEQAIYTHLTYGYMTDDSTIYNEIKRVLAGHYLEIKNHALTLHQYHQFDNDPNKNITESDAIETIDLLFRKSVAQEYDKDILYNLKHISPLSGGLDSRMTNFVANDLRYENCQNFTFSQYNYSDMIIAQDISTFLNNSWCFVDLSGGNFLLDFAEGIKQSHGCYRTTVRNSVTKIINFDSYGLLHSGQLGDAVISSHYPTTGYKRTKKVKTTSNLLFDRVEGNLEHWKNLEIAELYIRAMNGLLSGNFIYQPHTEVTSPFMDVEFAEFCLSIPLEMRGFHSIYQKWIIKKYPKAAHFKWENINAKITEKRVTINNKLIPVSQLPSFIIKGLFYRLGIDLDLNDEMRNTSPFDYWYQTNTKLKNYIDAFFSSRIDLIDIPEVKKDMTYQFTRGDMTDKLQVLYLLGTIEKLNK